MTTLYNWTNNSIHKAISTILVVLAALGGGAAVAHAEAPQFRVLCSTFPVYQITRNVVQGRQETSVSLMLPAQLGCPHDYALTPKDMHALATADVFVINGLGLEQFLGAPIQQANPRLTILDSSQGIPGILSSSGSPGGDHGRDHGRDYDGHDQVTHNPHLFASPKQAARMAATIARELSRLDSGGSETYLRNSQAYGDAMNGLAQELSARTAKLASTRIITQHGVFDYLARDVGLEVVAVIEPHPGQEPQASEMISLIKTAKASQAKAIFAEPQYPAKIIRTIAKEAGIAAAILDPVATGPDNAGLDYYEKVMRGNMTILESTLGVR